MTPRNRSKLLLLGVLIIAGVAMAWWRGGNPFARARSPLVHGKSAAGDAGFASGGAGLGPGTASGAGISGGAGNAGGAGALPGARGNLAQPPGGAGASPAQAPGPTLKPAFESEMIQTARRDFQNFAEHLLQTFPRKSDLQGLTAHEAHETPQVVREAAVHLGQVADLLAKNAALKPEGLAFYKKCSLEQSLPDSVRALCLHHALLLHADLHQELWDFDRHAISPEILSLAKHL